jgi:hypothetical protein
MLLLARVLAVQGAPRLDEVRKAIDDRQPIIYGTRWSVKTIDIVDDTTFTTAPTPSCSITGCWLLQLRKPSLAEVVRCIRGRECGSKDSLKLLSEIAGHKEVETFQLRTGAARTALLARPLAQACYALDHESIIQTTVKQGRLHVCDSSSLAPFANPESPYESSRSCSPLSQRRLVLRGTCMKLVVSNAAVWLAGAFKDLYDSSVKDDDRAQIVPSQACLAQACIRAVNIPEGMHTAARGDLVAFLGTSVYGNDIPDRVLWKFDQQFISEPPGRAART